MDPERAVALNALLDRLPAARISGNPQQSVRGIEIDSQRVRPGTLFVALRGSRTDGHRYLSQAVAKGACAVVVEEADLPPLSGVTIVRVADSRRALSALSSAFYGDPSQQLDVIGVTGTNGKTTTTRMVAAILNQGGVATGVIGTVGAEFGDKSWRLEHTTPLPPELHGLFAQMRDAGAKAVAIEVSSHALALGRVDDVRFRVAALTNLTRDHLDFHQTFEAYAAAKRHLFDLTQLCVLNLGDAAGARWALQLGEEKRVVSYGDRSGAMYVAEDIAVDSSGSRFKVNGRSYELHLPGRFNVWNAVAAIAIAEELGVDRTAIAHGLAALPRVPGRMERLGAQGVDVVVDYAHTPDALESALRSLRETTAGRLAVVFGCGGDRDRGKRSEMGAVAARLADRLYLTSDNPRSEDPQAIVDGIVAGIGPRERVIELDRRRAIERAIAEARSGDVVLVAGKGHEAYQIVGERVLPFDDMAIVREALSPGGVRS